MFSVSEETIIKLGKSPVDSVRLPESMGDFVAAMEVFHQLHCLVTMPPSPTLNKSVFLQFVIRPTHQ